ncbi:hypothetical protein BU16DRAFT_238253 [Lophium mytilinum]|uniref:Uncharacterized protein n=1 Tax=Lophium mytilinum TaxID=390894 RepID=A0A6A6R6F5_9PEZI|nr:hypothetical protein BU16DRAFT_238253 [Lophium mytilinum]
MLRARRRERRSGGGAAAASTLCSALSCSRVNVAMSTAEGCERWPVPHRLLQTTIATSSGTIRGGGEGFSPIQDVNVCPRSWARRTILQTTVRKYWWLVLSRAAQLEVLLKREHSEGHGGAPVHTESSAPKSGSCHTKDLLQR